MKKLAYASGYTLSVADRPCKVLSVSGLFNRAGSKVCRIRVEAL